jgi:hypothetical protein
LPRQDDALRGIEAEGDRLAGAEAVRSRRRISRWRFGASIQRSQTDGALEVIVGGNAVILQRPLREPLPWRMRGINGKVLQRPFRTIAGEFNPEDVGEPRGRSSANKRAASRHIVPQQRLLFRGKRHLGHHDGLVAAQRQWIPSGQHGPVALLEGEQPFAAHDLGEIVSESIFSPAIGEDQHRRGGMQRRHVVECHDRRDERKQPLQLLKFRWHRAPFPNNPG